METIREQLEELERVTLSKYAALSCNSQGRDREEAPDSTRRRFSSHPRAIITGHA